MTPDLPANHRVPPPEWREEWSRELARPLVENNAGDSIAMLVFRLGAEWFSLPAQTAVEITHVPSIHRIPHRPPSIGVVNVRGRITASVDLASILEPLPKTPTEEVRLVVFKQDTWLFATRVDSVDGVYRMELSRQAPPPAPIDASRFTIGLWPLKGRSIARLDEGRLFTRVREALA